MTLDHGPRAFFGVTALRLDSTLKKALFHTSAGRFKRYTDQVRCVLVLVGVHWGMTWVPGSRHSCHVAKTDSPWVSECRPFWLSLPLTGLGLTPDARCLRHPVSRECQRGPRHFWSRLACLGYGLSSRSHIKKAFCHTLAW